MKGYEHEKGKFVVLEDEDFDKVNIESTQTMEITDFVELAEINPKFFYKPYFLEATKGGEKAYALLNALQDRKDRDREGRDQDPAISGRGEAGWAFLILELMHFAQEVLDPETLKERREAGCAP